MDGWEVIALDDTGRDMIKETYGNPTRGEKIMTKIKKTCKDPLTYKVTFRNKKVAEMLSVAGSEMSKQVYRSFAKHKKISVSKVKKHVKVKLI